MPDVRKEVESLLFSSGKVMTAKELSDIIGARPKDIEKALLALKKDYDSRDTSLALMQVGEGWKLNVKEQFTHVASRVVADTELPKPIIMTLSVIAHKAPANQAEVIKARGTNAYEHIQTLIEQGFVERKKHGRSFQVVLTPKFFEYFEVEGDQNLKMIFKDIKPSEPKQRKKLGNLDVVDVAPDGSQPSTPGQTTLPAAAGVGGLEVVDIPPPKKAEPFKPDHDFLNDIDSRIGEMSKKNDELDTDEDFKRPDEGEAAPAEGQETEPEFVPPENKKMKDIFGEEKSNDKGEDEDSSAEVEEEDAKEESAPKDPLDEDEDKLDL